jgi:hypothetical protein
MATTTETKTTRTSLSSMPPSPFTSRFEIRRLTEKDIPVVSAILITTNLYDSPVWPICYPDNITQRCYEGVQAADYLVRHQINDGQSFGVFDTEYKYKTAEAEAAGGLVLWDETKLDATAQELDAQIDSPMVSIALSYDAHNALDMEKMGPLMAALPLFGPVYHRLEICDPRDQATLAVSGRGEVLKRNATSTRTSMNGLGVTKKMANWLMAYAKGEGYKHINIECIHDKVTYIWSNPVDKTMRGDVVSAFRTDDYTEVDDEGRIVLPFRGAKQRITKIYVTLNAA